MGNNISAKQGDCSSPEETSDRESNIYRLNSPSYPSYPTNLSHPSHPSIHNHHAFTVSPDPKTYPKYHGASFFPSIHAHHPSTLSSVHPSSHVEDTTNSTTLSTPLLPSESTTPYPQYYGDSPFPSVHPCHPSTLPSVPPFSHVEDTTNSTTLCTSLLPSESIIIDNTFNSKNEVSLAVNQYHKTDGKQARTLVNNKYVIQHICIETYQFLRAKNKISMNGTDHLCQALHVARRKTHPDGSDYYIVTECVPHTCDSSKDISIPRSRKSSLTSKQMSTAAMSFMKEDPFQSPAQIGNCVKVEFNLPDGSLCYQQKHRVRNICRSDHFGSTETQYSTLVSRLELIKKHDPDSVILLKVFPDKISEGVSDRTKEDSSVITTSQDGKSTKSFCLRFGAVAITPGSAVRRHAYNKNSAFQALKLNCSMDACHLSGTGRECLTDIMQPMAGNEYLLDTFSVDAQNECNDAWHLALSCDKEALDISSSHSFCGDRQKGQYEVNDYVYPDLDFTKCHFHLKKNITELGGGNQVHQDVFQELAYSLTDVARTKTYNKHMRGHRPVKVKEYLSKSINPDKHQCDVYDMPGEKEVIFTCQMSESFHKTLKILPIRELPIPYIPDAIISYEHETIHKMQQTYYKLLHNKELLPPFLQHIITKRTKNVNYYDIDTIPSSHNLSARVTFKFNKEKCTHVIDLSVCPPT